VNVKVKTKDGGGWGEGGTTNKNRKKTVGAPPYRIWWGFLWEACEPRAFEKNSAGRVAVAKGVKVKSPAIKSWKGVRLEGETLCSKEELKTHVDLL